MLTYFFIVPVWGVDYTQTFLEYSLPSQLSDGNIPAMEKSPDSKYLIVTTREDWRTISVHPAYYKLKKFIKVEPIFPSKNFKDAHAKMSYYYLQGIKAAYKNKNAVISFITPDLVVSDCSFKNAQSILASGKRVIYVTGIRTNIGQITSLLSIHKNCNNDTLTVNSREIMRYVMRTLHQCSLSSVINETNKEPFLVPSHLYWKIGDEGILARCFHLHPLFVFPENKRLDFKSTVDDDYVYLVCPDEDKHHIVTDSDEILVIEMSNYNRLIQTGIAKKDNVDRDLLFWMLHSVKSNHLNNLRKVVYMHTNGYAGAKWQEAIGDSDIKVRELVDNFKKFKNYINIMKVKYKKGISRFCSSIFSPNILQLAKSLGKKLVNR